MDQIKNNFPYAINKKADSLEIFIYDDIEPDSYSWWTGETIKSDTSAKTISQFLEENPNVSSIDLHINSNGGDVKEAMAIYSLLKRHNAQTTAYIDGFAASAASVVPMACDKIVMSAVSLMFIHHAWMIASGNPEQLRKAADDLEVIDGQSNRAYLEKAGDKLTPEKLTELLDGETWLSASECLELGLCDEVESEQKDEPKTVAQKMFNSYQQKIAESMSVQQKTVIQKMADNFRKNK